MASLYGIPLLLQVGLPILLLAWFAAGRNSSRLQWLARATAILLYLAAMHVAGLWVVLPWYTAVAFAAGLAIVALLQVRGVRRLPWRDQRVVWRASTVSSGILATFAVTVLATAAVARRPPQDEVIDLRFPLRDGVYYVANGGSVGLMNSHLLTLTGERFRAYRGQSYGVDLLKLDTFGMRASGLLPANPARYAIYGEPVHAPCSGVVVQSEDGAPDMPPPQPDRSRMAGNYVLLDCNGVHVLLGHLKPGTVRARPGQWIDAAAIVGLVGNSGNSNEPHLHVHAQRPGADSREPLSGEPLPMRFDGRHLVRNDRVTEVSDMADK